MKEKEMNCQQGQYYFGKYKIHCTVNPSYCNDLPCEKFKEDEHQLPKTELKFYNLLSIPEVIRKIGVRTLISEQKPSALMIER